jgi:hypothetical protein
LDIQLAIVYPPVSDIKLSERSIQVILLVIDTLLTMGITSESLILLQDRLIVFCQVLAHTHIHNNTLMIPYQMSIFQVEIN